MLQFTGINSDDMATVPETMNCPACGAPVASDATQCEHCGARLQTVACPSCFGMVFAGAKFCSHCGAAIARTEVAPETKELCPHCKVNMEAVVIGKENLRECPKCEGIWVDTASLQRICEDREEQAAVLGTAGPVPDGDVNLEEQIHYLPCPVCGGFMNRVNFAHCSHVVVNVCRAHGTWFDKDQLRKIVEFIRAGGMDKARQVEIAELEQKRRQLSSAQISGGGGLAGFDSGVTYPRHELGNVLASAAIDLVTSFFFKR